jgi:D-sedoheptulose 7-phosphate isomerase
MVCPEKIVCFRGRDIDDRHTVNKHLGALLSRAPALDVCRGEITKAFEVMRDSFRSGGKLLLCGNGGSAADAEHMAGELLKGFLKKRPLSAERSAKLGSAVASHLQGALPAIPLGSFLSLRTAFANDCDAEYIYAQLVYALGRPGDVLLGISTSGNAQNVCHALEIAANSGMRTILLTGANGGTARNVAELSICAPATEVHLIQEQHLPIYHCLSLMLEDEFFGD